MPKVRRRRDEHVYFENGQFTVTERNLKTARKTYRIANIEKIALRRDPFYFALALAAPCLGFFYAFNGLLYDYERWILGGGSAFIVLVTSQLGVLFIESKALSEMAALASMKTLRKVRSAVEDAIDDHDQGSDANDDDER